MSIHVMKMIGWVKRSTISTQTRVARIPSDILSGLKTANKTGELTGVENDAAIVYSQHRTYILCIISPNDRSEDQIETIRHISSLIYNYINSE